jgi:hypothetical protein
MDLVEKPGKTARLGDWLWFLAWALASSVWCVTAAVELGVTFDETIYVEQGFHRWRTGNHGNYMGPGTMPLPVDVETLPLYLWECWRGVPFDPRDDLEQLLPVARVTALVFWWLLLAYSLRMGRCLAGRWGGRLAVALLACEPFLLGHAGLATTDIAVSACVLALAYHYRTTREAGWKRRLGLPALWYGLAISAKASGLVFGPLCMLAVELERLIRTGAFRRLDISMDDGAKRAGWRQWVLHVMGVLGPSVRDGAVILATGFFLMLFFCANDRNLHRPLANYWASWLPEDPLGSLITGVCEHFRSLPNGFHGLRAQFRHNRDGHGWILLNGVQRVDPFWYYFPLGLSMKLTASFLLLSVLVMLLRARALLNGAALAALALLAFTPFCRVQIGVRLVMPLAVLAVVGVAVAVVQTWQAQGAAWRRRLLSCSAGAAVVWAGAAAVLVWPHGICYTNELWGGTAEGYRVLTDSNYDWGQGLKELLRWQRAHAVDQLDVWYFGNDPLIERLPMRYVLLDFLPLEGPEGALAKIQGHYLAVSTTRLSGYADRTPAGRYLRSCQPVGRTMTYFIYDFTHLTDAERNGMAGPSAEHTVATEASE